MVKNKVLSRPLPDASVPRNAFDKSKRVNLNLPFGAIVPCYHGVALAGSRWQCNVNTFFRTAKVNTAAFPRLKMQTSFYAVPIRFLWSYWDNFKLGINDYNSTALFTASGGYANIVNPSGVPAYNIKAIWDLVDNNIWSDSLGYAWSDGATRLLDNLGYGRYKAGQTRASGGDSSFVQLMNLFKAAAYQKIYYDHFRNTAYESNDPMAYNLDWCERQAGDYGDVIRKLFTLRYANYRKDYFQHLFPSLNYVKSTPTAPLSSLPSWIRGLATDAVTGSDASRWTQNDGQTPPSDVALKTGATYSNNVYAGANRLMHTHVIPSSVGYNVQSIRASFALDKLLRSSAYAPKHVKEQYEARYGIKFSSKVSYESDLIGNFDTDIVIGEVTSTANTSSAGGDQLGDIGGKGVGSSDPRQNHMVSYNVTEDSIIIGVCYAIPRSSYDSYRFDNWNMKLVQGDFFMPEFMNLGLKPVYVKELAYTSLNSNGTRTNYDSTHLNYLLGYQTPYLEYKCDIDENHGLFADHDSELAQFVVHTSTYAAGSAGNGIDYSYFKVKPSDLDSIFVTAADGTESTDHLFGEITMTIPVNQNMSVHGQPSL